MLVRRKSACKTSAGSSKIFRWLATLLGPNLDPKTGPKQRPKRRNENVIQFWTHFGVHIWTQKWGQPSENFVAARKCFASRFATQQLEHECQHIPFLFVRPKAACYCRGLSIAAMFEHFFRPCFRGHDEAGLLAFEALRGSPRPARGQASDTKRNGRIYINTRQD